VSPQAVQTVDGPAASALLRVAQAAQLLGTRVILTGMSGEIAQSLVHLRADLGSIVPLRDLQHGISYALEQSGRRRGQGRDEGERPLQADER